MSVVGKVNLKYVHANRTKRGRYRYYFRKPGEPLVRLNDDPSSEAFMALYRNLMAGERPKPAPSRHKIKDGSLRALCVAYLSSPEFAGLSPATQAQRRRVVDSICLEPMKPGDERLFAEVPAKAIAAKHVRVLRDRKASVPEAANHRLKLLRQVFAWGCENEWMTSNPVRDVKALANHSDGHHTWVLEEVARFLQTHPAGSQARLALGLLLFMGIRISDLALIGPPHARDGVHTFRPYKGRERTPKTLDLPILPELAAILKTSSTGKFTYLVTEAGKPFSIKGLGNKFRDWCDKAELLHCSAHGLRKAGATIAAENGATEEDLKAIFGWENAKEANTYTKKARQKVIARRAISMIDYGETVKNLIHLNKKAV